jgi:hypothetical protein
VTAACWGANDTLCFNPFAGASAHFGEPVVLGNLMEDQSGVTGSRRREGREGRCNERMTRWTVALPMSSQCSQLAAIYTYGRGAVVHSAMLGIRATVHRHLAPGAYVMITELHAQLPERPTYCFTKYSNPCCGGRLSL